MFLEEGGGAAQHGIVNVIAQVGDHAEAAVIHQVGAGIVAYSLQRGGDDQGEGNDRPVIVQAVRDDVLQVKDVMRAGNAEKSNLAARNRGIQYALEYGADKQKAKRLKQTDQRQQNDRDTYLKPVRPQIMQ